MIIQHNLSAITAYGNLSTHNTSLNKNTKKIGSGYRINVAADDAAKLAVSEKMRNQIRGLNQSVRNVQDGANFIRTADGAMGEIHSILHRMNELTIQSLNDTYTETDRAAMAAEFEQLQSEIDNISKHASYGRTPVFEEHEPSYYQVSGYRSWAPDQTHAIISPDNSLQIHLPPSYTPCDYTITVPDGIYTTQELVDEIDDAITDIKPFNPGFEIEYTDDGHCNLNFENGDGTTAEISSVGGPLSYLIYDSFTGTTPASLLGTTAFQGNWPLTIASGRNDTLGFYIEKTDGSGSSYVDIKIPAKQYTRQELIDLLNQELSKLPNTAGVVAKEYGTSCIQITGGNTTSITGLKGNMFKLEDPNVETVYTSVFYDNTRYGSSSNTSASITGGAGYRENYTKKITIDNSNNTLKFTVNNNACSITLANNDYTMAELVNELNSKLTAAGIEAAARTTTNYINPGTGNSIYCDCLFLSSTKEGTGSTLEFDTTDTVSAKAYETLFQVTNFDFNTNPSSYSGQMQVTGRSNLSGAITIDSSADTLSISVSNETPPFTMKIPAKTYNSLNDLITELNNQIPFARQGKIEFIRSGNALAIRGISDEVTNISIEKTGAYKQLFAGEAAKYVSVSGSGIEHYPQGGTAPDQATMATVTMPYGIPENNTVINNSNNYLYFYLNGSPRTITLTPGSYSRSGLIAEFNKQLQKNNYPVTASLTGDALTLTTTLTGISQTLSISVSSSYGDGWKAFLGTTESEPSKPTTSYIQGINNFQDITIDSSNNELILTYNNKNTYHIKLPEKDYSMDELVTALQQAIDHEMGLTDEGTSKITVKKNSSGIRLDSYVPFVPTTTPIDNFYNTVLGKYIDTTTKLTPSQVTQGSHKSTEAFIIGRQDLTGDPVEIKAGFNDSFILDLTYNSSKNSADNYMKTMEIKIPEGTYTGDEITAYLKDAMNKKFADEGIDGFELDVTVGGQHNTGVTGSNDAVAMQITMTEKAGVENPAGTYLIDGIRGNASYFIFYKTTGKLTPSYVTGAEDLSDGVQFPAGKNTFSFCVDSVPYSYTFPEDSEYTADELIDMLNHKFQNGDDSGAISNMEASLEDGRLKLTYRGYGAHNITDLSGSARGVVFYHEEDRASQNAFNLHVGANSNQSMELPRLRVSSSALGVNSITITKRKYAEKSLERLSQAIDTLSARRSLYGAMENRLKHISSNNQNTSENVQASESIVRDTDFSTEMVDYSKNNILFQVTQSVLAQANQTPTRILDLLHQL